MRTNLVILSTSKLHRMVKFVIKISGGIHDKVKILLQMSYLIIGKLLAH